MLKREGREGVLRSKGREGREGVQKSIGREEGGKERIK